MSQEAPHLDTQTSRKSMYRGDGKKEKKIVIAAVSNDSYKYCDIKFWALAANYTRNYTQYFIT